MDAAEQALQDAGYRTRLQRWANTGEADPEERKRLREESYAEVRRATAVIHVLASGQLAGTRLHHALNRAVLEGVPVLLLSCPAFREEHDIGLPSPQRVASLLDSTGGEVVLSLDELPTHLQALSVK